MLKRFGNFKKVITSVQSKSAEIVAFFKLNIMDTRKSLILHFDSLDVIDELSEKQTSDLFIAIRDYNLWKEIKLDWLMKAIFIPFKNQFDRDLEKYNKKCEINRENGKRWWRPKETQSVILETETNQSEAKKPYNDNDSKSNNNNDNKKDSNNNIILSKDKEQSSEIVLKEITLNIDNLIKELKDTADKLEIAYDKNKDRNFAKFILTAKEYWNFCEKIWQNRIDFAKNIMLASVKIWFWKWICAWPMMIYQNYSEVYNKALEKKNNTNNKKWIWVTEI